MSLGSRTCGAAVLKTMVCGSVAFASTMGLVKVANGRGAVGHVGHALQGEQDVLGGEGRAVVEAHVLAQLELHVRSSTARHENGQPRHQLLVVVALDQRLEDVEQQAVVGERL
jgi:hypothetical protein